jgi:uncharacterized phiE125 gp8 family phage protein
MMMVELTSVPAADLPLEALSDHLRLSSGFADDGSQNAQLERCIRSALAVIEARISKALFQRQFMLTLKAWACQDSHPMPVAPVVQIDAITLIARDGTTRVIDADTYVVLPDAHRPQLMTTGTALPSPGLGGSVEVAFTAGFNANWGGIPADLKHAMLMLAAEFYNHSAEVSPQMPPYVTDLIDPYRHLRVGRSA